jgi:cysteine dioxygenase
MSTSLETSKQSSDLTDVQFSLASLAATLESLESSPSLEQIFEWLNKVEISDAELQPYSRFKEGNYFRNRVCRTTLIEMLVLCWQPGQRTPIHDHNGSHGGVKVCKGTLWETTFKYDQIKGLRYKSARDYSVGLVTGSDVPDIHQLGNPDVSEQNLITLHVYSPPLGVLHTYKPGSAKIDLYVPDETVQA